MNESTALVTQLKASRLDTLFRVVERWRKPLVAVVYTNSSALWKNYATAALRMRNLSNVLLLFVISAETLYPINWLRNLGLLHVLAPQHQPKHLAHTTRITQVTTSHVFVIDVDFIPSEGLHDGIMAHVTRPTAGVKPMSVAYVVPAFEIRTLNASLPFTKVDLKKLVSTGKAGQFHERITYAHRPTNYAKWYTAESVYPIRQGLCHRTLYEPYVVIATNATPFYPEIFIQRRFNKVVYLLQLCIQYVQLTVVPDGFLIHVPHPREKASDLKGFNPCVEDIFLRYKRLLFSQTEWRGVWEQAELKRKIEEWQKKSKRRHAKHTPIKHSDSFLSMMKMWKRKPYR